MLWYFATRVLGLLALVSIEQELLNEITKWIVLLVSQGPLKAFPEYPWPMVTLLYLPLRLGVPTVYHYFISVVLFMLAVDALLTWVLWRAGGRRMSPGLCLWLIFFPALGPLVVTRFDLLPAALTAASLVALASSRSASAGALLALGTGLKLWPAVGLPGLLLPGNWSSRARVLIGFFACAVLLAGAAIAAAGFPALWSPFSSQLDRGLQIEAVAGLPFMWARYLDGAHRWSVGYLPHACRCFEISGPGVHGALMLSTAAFAVGAVALIALYVRACAKVQPCMPALAPLFTALGVGLWLITARVLSPQYVIWLAAPLAALGTMRQGPLERLDLGLFIALAAATQVIYPIGYEALLVERNIWQPVVLLVLTLRDALLAILIARLAIAAWRSTTPTSIRK